MERFEFRNELKRLGPMIINGSEYSSEFIISRLAQVLTDERKLRIDSIVEGRTWNVTVLGESLYDIGNISAVMRSAESFGFMQFQLIERPGAKYKKSDRISKGSEKWLHIEKHGDPESCIQKLKKQSYQVLAATLEGGKDIAQMDFSKPTALLFGNEKDGVSKEALAEVDDRFFIPMLGFTQSFNISVAAALSFYHVYKERIRIFDKSGDLSDTEKLALKAQYYLRSVGDDKVIQGFLNQT